MAHFIRCDICNEEIAQEQVRTWLMGEPPEKEKYPMIHQLDLCPPCLSILRREFDTFKEHLKQMKRDE